MHISHVPGPGKLAIPSGPGATMHPCAFQWSPPSRSTRRARALGDASFRCSPRFHTIITQQVAVAVAATSSRPPSTSASSGPNHSGSIASSTILSPNRGVGTRAIECSDAAGHAPALALRVRCRMNPRTVRPIPRSTAPAMTTKSEDSRTHEHTRPVESSRHWRGHLLSHVLLAALAVGVPSVGGVGVPSHRYAQVIEQG